MKLKWHTYHFVWIIICMDYKSEDKNMDYKSEDKNVDMIINNDGKATPASSGQHW